MLKKVVASHQSLTNFTGFSAIAGAAAAAAVDQSSPVRSGSSGPEPHDIAASVPVDTSFTRSYEWVKLLDTAGVVSWLTDEKVMDLFETRTKPQELCQVLTTKNLEGRTLLECIGGSPHFDLLVTELSRLPSSKLNTLFDYRSPFSLPFMNTFLERAESNHINTLFLALVHRGSARSVVEFTDFMIDNIENTVMSHYRGTFKENALFYIKQLIDYGKFEEVIDHLGSANVETVLVHLFLPSSTSYHLRQDVVPILREQGMFDNDSFKAFLDYEEIQIPSSSRSSSPSSDSSGSSPGTPSDWHRSQSPAGSPKRTRLGSED